VTVSTIGFVSRNMFVGGEGDGKALEIDTKYQISIGVGCMFASLWLVFMALYLQV